MEKSFFTVPDKKMQEYALGSLAGDSYKIKKSLTALINEFKGANWINEGIKNKIYIVPLEEMSKEFLESLQMFCQSFFYPIKVKIKELLDVKTLNAEYRINDYSSKPQYNARDLLRKLEKHLTKDAYCLLGILNTDLYPKEDWNFVFGIANIKNRTGVFSFARYYDSFYEEEPIESKLEQKDIIYRSCRVMIHEITHMFGIRHCIYYSCIMNGINSLEEGKLTPMQLCPVCLRKLQYNIGFDFLERYKMLENCCEKLGFDKDRTDYKNLAEKIINSFEPKKLSVKK